jgi:hypothetical protein
MANITFKDLTRILKYKRQISKPIKAAKNTKGNTDKETSESENNGMEVIRKNLKKVPIR